MKYLHHYRYGHAQDIDLFWTANEPKSTAAPSLAYLELLEIHDHRYYFHLNRLLENLDFLEAFIARATDDQQQIVLQKEQYVDADFSAYLHTIVGQFHSLLQLANSELELGFNPLDVSFTNSAFMEACEETQLEQPLNNLLQDPCYQYIDDFIRNGKHIHRSKHSFHLCPNQFSLPPYELVEDLLFTEIAGNDDHYFPVLYAFTEIIKPWSSEHLKEISLGLRKELIKQLHEQGDWAYITQYSHRKTPRGK